MPENIGEELGNKMIEGWTAGLIEGVKLLAPYFIGFLILYIGGKLIARYFRNRKK